MKHLSAPAGIEIGLSQGRPAVGPGIRIDERATRRLCAMAPVSATPVSPSARRIQYWMLNGIVREEDASRVDPRLCYDFTYLPDRPVAWERCKTFGHSHPRPGPENLGFGEVLEVLEGTAGFLLQDLFPGPRSTYAALVTAQPGERVIFPPSLAHASVNLGSGQLVFSDIIDRRIVERQLPSDYSKVAAARGLAYHSDLEGDARPNPTYLEVPPLPRFTAEEWSGPTPDLPLYRDYVERPDNWDWIHDPDLFPKRFPALWERVAGVITRMDAHAR